MLGTYTFNYRTDSLYSTDSFTANRKVGDRRAGLESASKRRVEDLMISAPAEVLRIYFAPRTKSSENL